MAIKIQNGVLSVGNERTHTFNNKVISAGVAITEYKIGYDRLQEESRIEGGGDHHVKDVNASISILSVSGESVSVKAEGHIVDGSGNRGGGQITYTLIAETE